MKDSLLVLCLLALIVFVCGCAATLNSPKDVLPSDKYVAVLEEYFNSSTLIGNTTYPPVQPMPVPTAVPIFNYNNSRASYDLQHYGAGTKVNDSFKILLGKISYIHSPTVEGYLGTTSNGGYTSPYLLSGVYNLPCTIENAFTILNISQNGTITAVYGNDTIYLKPGDHWTSVIHRENTMGYYLANPLNESLMDFFSNPTQLPWPVTNEVSITITNEGVFDKSILKS